MADSGDSYERFFRASGPQGAGDGPDRTEVPRPPRTPHRRGAPSPAQQRLMARIESSRKARQRRAFLVAAGCVSALVLFVSGAGWALTGYVNHMVARVNAGTTPAAAGSPLNILVAGVDSRAGLSSHQEAQLHVGRVEGTKNSDTLMLVHVSPAHDRVTVVSLPRDSWVNVPGYGMNKINAAYGLGGPKLMVQTVEQATGLTINDYVEINFLAFVKVIDALGGVNVCLPEPLDDPSSGVRLSAGFHHLNGITALEYSRDRHSFPLEDLTRIQDQQSLISTAVSKIISSGTLANPVRMASLLNAVLPALRVDSKLNVSALADQMRGIASGDVVFATVPLASLDYQAPDGEEAVLWNAAQADRLFGEIGNDQPVVKQAPAKSRSAKNGQGHSSKPKAKHPAGWVPPGTRTAAQAACH
ncbi:MAG TPA: LCP family protein [Streptosporangiaceae bacterium]|jgi:LCP family protein required for cell wall assembly|nr:LCP family protein [Streptosporangiaceae bacterium]